MNGRAPAAWAVLLGVCMLVVPLSASAKERVSGVVLGIDAKNGTAIVRHEPFHSMPSMTMPFRIVPKSELTHLRAGDAISGTADVGADPWTLSNITVKASQKVVAAPIFRHVRVLKIGDTVAPSVPMLDQNGKPFTLGRLRGKSLVMAFIYTRCPDPRMCPLISAKFVQLQKLLANGPYHLVEFTLDPAYDRPPVLNAYAQRLGVDPARWTLATGDTTAMLDFAAQFGVNAFDQPDQALIHSESTVLVDAHGKILDIINETSWEPQEVAAELKGDYGNPLARFNLWLSKTAVAACGNSVAGFSGLLDLAVVLAIVAGFGWVIYRTARWIFRDESPGKQG